MISVIRYFRTILIVLGRKTPVIAWLGFLTREARDVMTRRVGSRKKRTPGVEDTAYHHRQSAMMKVMTKTSTRFIYAKK